MNISFFTGRTGLITQQQAMNIYSNNIANVNTTGFKPLRPSFADLIYTHQHHNRDEWQTGHGQRIAKTDMLWAQAGITFTDLPLDFAFTDDSFFMTMDRNGDTFLTREGRFTISNTGGKWEWELVNGFGDFVLDFDGNRIPIPFVMTDDGEYTTEIDYASLYQVIGTFTVPNIWGLDQAQNNRFVVTGRSGQPEINTGASMVPGALEMSAVDLANEMVRVIETQRSYQLNARVIQTSDELMRIVNNLR
ncbi:MAG: flagellar hook-basal body protein [Oscillospiraceae bacterium]|nr:flagellar hook-basal body protein [Oscillospiraceae bacterium]